MPAACAVVYFRARLDKTDGDAAVNNYYET